MYINLIENRRSVRSFKNVPIVENDLTLMNDYLSELNQSQGPFGRRGEFKYIAVSNHINSEGQKIGTYGVIRNPAGYIVGITKNERDFLIDFGYTFEKFMLQVLSLGLGTCWLGGTFDRKMLTEKFEKHSSHIIPAISPIGYHDEKPSLIEKTMRKIANSDQKMAFEEVFYLENFETPLVKSDAGIYEIPLEMVRIGPSASNKQPWRLVLDRENRVHFFLSHTPNYSGKLMFDMQYLDIGIAMFHFQSALDEIGINGDWCVIEGLQVPIDEPTTEYIMSWKIED